MLGYMICVSDSVVNIEIKAKKAFDFFKDKEDFGTGKPLFDSKAMEASQRFLKVIRAGFMSDPLDVPNCQVIITH
jgi:hypothetical protein